MAIKTYSQLIAEFPDNTIGQVTAGCSRDIIDTMFSRPVRIFTSGASTNLVWSVDWLLIVNKGTGSATAVNLPASPTAGWRFEVKDGKGDANTNPITVAPASGTIDGQSNYVINSPRGAAIFTYSGAEWVVT